MVAAQCPLALRAARAKRDDWRADAGFRAPAGPSRSAATLDSPLRIVRPYVSLHHRGGWLRRAEEPISKCTEYRAEAPGLFPEMDSALSSASGGKVSAQFIKDQV